MLNTQGWDDLECFVNQQMQKSEWPILDLFSNVSPQNVHYLFFKKWNFTLTIIFVSKTQEYQKGQVSFLNKNQDVSGKV